MKSGEATPRGAGFTRRAATGAVAGMALGISQVGRAPAVLASPSTAGDRHKLTMGLTRNLQTLPVIDARVSSPSIDPSVTTVYGTDLFARQLLHAEFDASEMSISFLLIAASLGDRRWVGLPVFTTRQFFHTFTLVRRDAGIHSPADLKGKRVGVPEYHQTAVLWARGVLQDEFGVGPRDMEIWMERAPGGSVASALGLEVPGWIRQIPPQKSIGSMMLSGELDAALIYIQTRDPQPFGDRSTADLRNSAMVKPLFPEPRAEAIRYFNKTGFHQINHCMILRRGLAQQTPALSSAIVGLFDAAAAAVDADRLAHVASHYAVGRIDEAAHEALKTPVVRHGVEANRRLLETMFRYSHEQGFTNRLLTLPEVFPGSA